MKPKLENIAILREPPKHRCALCAEQAIVRLWIRVSVMTCVSAVLCGACGLDSSEEIVRRLDERAEKNVKEVLNDGV
jgi:hypothetical protein